MELKEFRENMEAHLNAIEDLIHELPTKGTKAEDCQKVYLLQQLFELEAAVNGTSPEDMVESVKCEGCSKMDATTCFREDINEILCESCYEDWLYM